MFKELNNIIHDKKFKITVLDNKININNYDDIVLIDSDKVLLKEKDSIIKIVGNNLCLTKAVNKEILIEGNIYSIEMR